MFRQVLFSVFAASAAGLTLRIATPRVQSNQDVVLEGSEMPTGMKFAFEGNHFRRPRVKSRIMMNSRRMSIRILKAMTALLLMHTAVAEFCTKERFIDGLTCNDGSAPQEHLGCCRDTNECPSACSSQTSGFSNGVKICHCGDCSKERKPGLPEHEQLKKNLKNISGT